MSWNIHWPLTTGFMEDPLADKSHALVLEALEHAMAEPGGLPLFGGKSQPGLFAGSAAGKRAAQVCQSEGLLKNIRTEPRGKSTVAICAISEKGLAFLLDQVNPRPILEAFVRSLDARQGQFADLLADAHVSQRYLEELKETVQKVLERVAGGGCRAAGSNGDVASCASNSRWNQRCSIGCGTGRRAPIVLCRKSIARFKPSVRAAPSVSSTIVCANCGKRHGSICIRGPDRFTKCPNRTWPCWPGTRSLITRARRNKCPPRSHAPHGNEEFILRPYGDLPMTAVISEPSLSSSALEVLRRLGNPFRNYFARNPDDEVCARFHVPELYAHERDQLLSVVDLYRATPNMHSEMVPVLGNKGSGKTHLLHSIKHASDGAWQLLVTPGTYQKDTDFLEYLLFQAIDTLLGGNKQKGRRPLEYFSEEVGRNLLKQALQSSGKDEQLNLFPPPGLGRWARKLGLGGSQAQERTQWLLDSLTLGVSRNDQLRAAAASVCRQQPGRGTGLRFRLPIHRKKRRPQHGRPDAPAHLPGAGPRRLAGR